MVVAGVAGVACWFYFDAVTEVRRQWRKLSGLRQVITDMQNDHAFMLREYYAQPVTALPVRADDSQDVRAAADESAPKLVIFTDYDCSGCACFESRRPALIDAAFAGDVRIDYRCAPRGLTDEAPVTEDLSRASLAAVAARLQGGRQAFQAMHRLLFKHRKDRPGRDYAELAKVAGLDERRFLAEMNSDEVRLRVREDIALAAEVGVTTTPAVFLNGRRVPDLCVTSPAFWAAVAERLAERSTYGRFAVTTDESGP
jgi:protein-disulfide isomerase